MDVVLDCDIVSTLSKIDKIDLLAEIFRDSHIVIPNAVHVELLDAEGIAIARNRNGVFLTNDRVAVRFCEQNDVAVLDLKDILKITARKKIVDENEMIKIMKDIEVKDNTVIVERDEILKEYENRVAGY